MARCSPASTTSARWCRKDWSRTTSTRLRARVSMWTRWSESIARRPGSNRHGAAPIKAGRLLQARLLCALEHFRDSRLQRVIVVLLFLVVLGDPIEVELRSERFIECADRL